jgi:hypothetical protein
VTFTITLQMIAGTVMAAVFTFAAFGFWMVSAWSDEGRWVGRSIAAVLLAAAVGVAWWGWT